MDLDRDGIKDILTGSAKGHFYFFKGLGQGKFAAGQILKFSDGREIAIGSYSNAATVDWNGDGILDLVVYAAGNTPVQRMIGKEDLTFGEPLPILVGGRRLEGGREPGQIHDGRVVFHDWNGDGVPDLILGNGVGSITYYQGSRDIFNDLVLDTGIVWVQPIPQERQFALRVNWETKELIDRRSGTRPTISVTDWNGDGKLDLLVGDLYVWEPEFKPSEAQLERSKVLYAEQTELFHQIQAIQNALREEVLTKRFKVQKFADLTKEQRDQFLATLRETTARSKKLKALEERQQQVTDEVRRYRPSPGPRYGYVWVYLGK